MNTLLSTTLTVAGLALASCATSRSAPVGSVDLSEYYPGSESSSEAVAPAATASSPAPSQELMVDDYGPDEGDWEYTLGAAGNNDNDFDVGAFTLAGQAGYFLSEQSQVGLRQGLSFSDFGNSVWNASTRVFYDYHFLDGAFRPLIGANLGYVYGDSIDETLAAAPEVGFKWYLSDTAFMFMLAEYQFFFDSADEADDTFDDGSFVYTVGFGFLNSSDS